MRLLVTANRLTCYCEQVAPTLFRVDPAGTVEALTEEVPEQYADAALEAEGMCPTRSIRTRIED